PIKNSPTRPIFAIQSSQIIKDGPELRQLKMDNYRGTNEVYEDLSKTTDDFLQWMLLLDAGINQLLTRQFDSTEINELSSLISQLLLLSRKGHKYLILKGIIIIHVNFVITQDQELGDESLRYMKSSKASLLAPFNLYCLLSMARIHRFQDSISFQLSKVTYNE
ncbi:10052_t:CDS:2, partial [Entrophospora sp. SA101]